MISARNKDLNVLIYEPSGEEINYSDPDNFINQYISKIRFIKEKNIGKYPYTCNITLSSENGDATVLRNPIRFSEILEVCSDQKIFIIPVDDSNNVGICDEKEDTTKHYESEAVINLIPFFGKDHTLIQVILSDNMMIAHIPKIVN